MIIETKTKNDVNEMLSEVSKYHDQWILIANSFLKNTKDSEDIVQNMYIRLYDYDISLDQIKYNNGINKYFIYTTIRNMCMLVLKKKKNHLNIDGIQIEEPRVVRTELLDKIDEEIKTWGKYQATLFEIYMYTELSLRDLAKGSTKTIKKISNQWQLHEESIKRGTGICYQSIFDTISTCKQKLKDKLQ